MKTKHSTQYSVNVKVGSKYIAFSYHDTKSEADKRAKELRKKGKSARVVKHSKIRI